VVSTDGLVTDPVRELLSDGLPGGDLSAIPVARSLASSSAVLPYLPHMLSGGSA